MFGILSLDIAQQSLGYTRLAFSVRKVAGMMHWGRLNINLLH